MTEQTAIITEVKKDVRSLLDNPQVRTRFEQVLGRNSNAFIINILNALINNPDLADADPNTVITSALTIAALGLSISPALGQAAIAPFNTSVKVNGEWRKVKKAQPMIMKDGLMQLAHRTNKYRVINPGKLYEGESIELDKLTGAAHFKGGRTSHIVAGYYAYLELFNGSSWCEVMSVEEVTAWAMRYSKSWDEQKKQFSPKSKWATDFDAMGIKTVLRKALKRGPLDANMQNAITAEENGEPINPRMSIIQAPIIASDVEVEASEAEGIAETETKKPKRSREQNLQDLGVGNGTPDTTTHGSAAVVSPSPSAAPQPETSSDEHGPYTEDEIATQLELMGG